MQIYEKLLIVAGVVGAISSVCVFAVKVVGLVRKCIGFFTNLKKQVDTIEAHCRENYMRELQIIVMSEEMPIGERLRAGEEYINNGGNGEIKAKYKLLVHEYEKQNEE